MVWSAENLFEWPRGAPASCLINWDWHLVWPLIFTQECQKVWNQKSENVWVLIPTFVEVAGEKLVVGLLAPHPE